MKRMEEMITTTRRELIQAFEAWERDYRRDSANRYVNDPTRFNQDARKFASETADWFLYWLKLGRCEKGRKTGTRRAKSKA